jgi:hypothetical protein
MRTRLAGQAALVAGGLALLAGWALLGRQAAAALRGEARAAVAFADVECDPPGRLSRAEFLGEVQFLCGVPDRLSLAEDGLAARLGAAFAVHPWVGSVERVEVRPGRVRVRLAYRSAVLLVPVASGGAGRVLRPVDGRGVLLPLAAAEPGLPVLTNAVAPPAGASGAPWGDPAVEAAARAAASLRPYGDRLKVDRVAVEAGDVVLDAGGRRLRWGAPVGSDAGARLARLLAAAAGPAVAGPGAPR